ncbi:MAG: hypothetical protein V1644_01370, partial [Candidatus Micrarchaeota archaeon]
NSNLVFIKYNPLTAECGGNYALIANILNPVFPDDSREVKLRLHLPCKSDMVVVLSPQMGSPTTEFTDVLLSYVSNTGENYGPSIKVTTLPASAFAVDPKELVIDCEVNVVNGGSGQPLFGSLFVSLRNILRVEDFYLQYTPAFEIKDAVDRVVIATNGPVSLPGVTQSPNLNLSARINQASFVDAKWFEVRLTLDDKPPVTQYFIPSLCADPYYTTGVDLFVLNSAPGFFEDCAEAEKAISQAFANRAVITRPNGQLEVTFQSSVTMVKQANVQIQGTSTTTESLQIAKNIETASHIKKQLARLREVYGPKYFMLIGSSKAIPMPSLAQSSVFSLDGLNPADVLYLYNPGDAKVDVEFSRIPIALDESNPWGFAAKVFKNALAARSRTIKNELMISDSCGQKGNCFIGAATRTAAANYWHSCSNNLDCLWSPPYCKLKEGSTCRGVSEIATGIASADFVHVNARSNARDFYSVGDRDNFATMFGASDLLPAGNNGFIASTTASYAGSIDSSFAQVKYGGLKKDDALTFSLLNAGAGLVIANPRMGIIQRVPIPLLEFEHVVFQALQNKDSRSIGAVINEKRNALLANNGNELFRFSALHGETYGDPLIHVYKQT